MKIGIHTSRAFSGRAAITAAVLGFSAHIATAATYDSGGTPTNSWFVAENWNGNVLPVQGGPTSGSTHEINNGESFSGEGVLFDPVNDVNNTTGSNTYTLGGNTAEGTSANLRLYIANGTAAVSSKLTIKSGTLRMFDGGDNVVLGRSTNLSNIGAVTGVLVIDGGSFVVSNDNTDVGSTNTNGATTITSRGILDFRGGTFEGGLVSASSHGIRLASGAGSHGTFISRNDAPGSVTAFNYVSAQGAAGTGGAQTHGVSEFHYSNGGVNTVNVQNNLTLNNDGTAARRSYLNFVLDSAPEAKGDDGTFYIPEDIGLFNVDSDGNGTGNGATGAGNSLFYNLASDTALTAGSTVSASFGGYTYNWTIQYAGNIVGGLISASGGKDVVLIGLSSNAPIPEPTSIATLAIGALAIGRRRMARQA